MTCDDPILEFADIDSSELFILWTRPAIEPTHWTAEAAGDEFRVAVIHADIGVAFPGLERLILPAGEKPCLSTT